MKDKKLIERLPPAEFYQAQTDEQILEEIRAARAAGTLGWGGLAVEPTPPEELERISHTPARKRNAAAVSGAREKPVSA